MSFLSGKLATVRYTSAPTTLKIRKWRVVPKVDTLDFSNGDDGVLYQGGLFDIDVTIDYDYYKGDAIMAAFIAGSTVSTVKLYLDGTAGVFWSIASLFIPESPVEAEVRGKVSGQLVGKGFGTIIAPTS